MAPSDHLILKESEFLAKVNQALAYSSQNEALLTLGISPTRPDTGYGYIKYQESSIENQAVSTEKQDLAGKKK